MQQIETQQPEPQHKSRTLLVVLAAIVVLISCIAGIVAGVVALYVPTRSEVTLVEPGIPEAEPPAERTIESEAAAVADAIAGATGDWASHVTDVSVVTVLRRPVILIATDVGPEQAGLSEEISSALASFAGGLTAADGSYYSYYLQILSSEGDIMGAIASTDDRWKLEAPAAPTDADALLVWLTTVYGPGPADPEPWVSRITSVEIPAEDPDGYVVVRTNLDPAEATDLRAAQTIIDAVNSSGSTFAPGIRVLFADGAFEWSSLLDGVDPYAP